MMRGYGKLRRHRATIKRNATTVSGTGSTKVNYAVVAENVPCLVMGRGGRRRQDEFGQIQGRTHSAIFGPEVMEAPIFLQQNDLITVTSPHGETFRAVHVHAVPLYGHNHVEADLDQWVSSGGD